MKRQNCGLRSDFARLLGLPLVTLLVLASTVGAGESANSIPRDWSTRQLSLAEALDLAVQQNGTILKGKSDLEAAYGIVVQTRAIALPKVRVAGQFQAIAQNAVDTPAGATFTLGTDKNWTTEIRLVQSVYEGGRINSALRSAKLTQEQALLQYQSVVADTLLGVRTNYYDILLAAQQIVVREASVNLLQRELDDQKRRFDAGTVPRFNVLRAEVAVANARPQLIRARNAERVAKNNLVNLLGYNLPRSVGEDVPVQLTDKLDAVPYQIDLAAAIGQALEKRPELGALRKTEALKAEGIVNASAGYKPSVQIFGGYGDRSSSFSSDLSTERHGWLAGAQLSWDVFDGLLTRGKIVEAKAVHQKSQTELADTSRRIELEVRTAYSDLSEAREVLESQKKVQEQAEESLRLANARADAGSSTQLEVLDAETALTEARTTQSLALRDYAVAVAQLERAMGTMAPSPPPQGERE
jgi:outer membrane protein TolC